MVQSLARVMFRAKLEPACTDCRLYSENGKPRSLLYVECRATARDFEVQLRSERFGTLLAIMERAPQAPELELRTVSDQRGLEYLSAVRLSPGENRSREQIGDPIWQPEHLEQTDTMSPKQ